MGWAASDAVQFDGGVDPLVDEVAQLVVVGDLGSHVAVVAVAELVVRAVALGRVGFAATAVGAAGVVLLRERSWSQVAEGQQSGFDVLDCVGQLGFGRHVVLP